MDIFRHLPHVRCVEKATDDDFADIVKAGRPVLLKGMVANWDAVKAGKESPESLCAYLGNFCTNQTIPAFRGKIEMRGRFFYSDDLIGRNFEATSYSFEALVRELLHLREVPDPDFLYAGSIPLAKYLPGLRAHCPMGLIDPALDPLVSLWIGNKTVVSAHWDEQQNLACVLAGRRRFTLFPVEQISNLYFGPFNNTIAGQPISLVDFDAPDLQAHPRFLQALAAAEVAELEPGDVLYMPSLWIHHVRSLETFGAMINFWWQDCISYLQAPSDTLILGLISLKDRAPAERARWRAVFEHYLFQEGDPMSHVPPPARGVFGPMTPSIFNAARGMLLSALTRK